MTTRPMRLLAAGAVVAALGLAGCASSPTPAATGSSGAPLQGEALVAAAKSDGALTVYGAASDASLKAWTGAFTKRYGIPVTIKRAGTAQLYQLYEQEEAAGQHQADVIDTFDKSALDGAIKNHWIAKYTPKDADKLPQQYARPGYYYAVQNVSIPTIAYNTANVTPAEVAKLKADPMHFLATAALKGRVMTTAPQAGRNPGTIWWQYTQGSQAKSYGWKNAAAIAANVTKVTDSVTLTQNLIQGEADFGVALADTYITTLISTQGVPLAYAYPKDTSAISDAMAISAGAPHPNAARLFDEWAASKEGVEAYAVGSDGKPIRSDVKDPRTYTSEPWFVEAPSDLWTTYDQDAKFLAAMQDGSAFYDKWNTTFGYSG